MTDTAPLRALLAMGTPGPWAWFHNRWETHLATVNRGRIFVMGFARRGMHGAQPMFQVSGFMKTAAELGDDLGRHPDAALIVAAVNALPALLDDLDALRAENARLREALDYAMAFGHSLAVSPAPSLGHNGEQYTDCPQPLCHRVSAALAATSAPMTVERQP